MQGSKTQAKKCTEETTLPKEKRAVHVSINGNDIPMGEFVQKFIMRTIAGMLGSLKKAELKEGSEIEIKIRYRK